MTVDGERSAINGERLHMAFIIDDILLSPIRLTVWVAEKLRDAAFQEMTDDSRVHEELLHLQMRYEMGVGATGRSPALSDDEFEAEETRLMEKLEEIRKIKEEQAL